MTHPPLAYRFSPYRFSQCWKTPLLAIPSAQPWASVISCKGLIVGVNMHGSELNIKMKRGVGVADE